MEGKLIKNTAGEYYLIVLHRNLPRWFNVALELSDGYYAIASSHHIDGVEGLHKLSLSNCQAIERGYDLNELAEEWVFETNAHKWSNNDDTAGDNYGSFKAGFQKALEILCDKKFSEDDVRLMLIDMARFIATKEMRDDWYFDVDAFFRKRDFFIDKQIQSLQQTEFDIVIEMEDMYDCGSSMCRNGCQSMDKFGEGCSGHSSVPKLDQNGCLILKRK